MSIFLAELIGTALLIILGDGVVANCLLNKSKGQNGGWIVITMGWAMAVFVGVFAVGSYSGAHLNSAVTIAMAVAGNITWDQVPMYIGAQMLGAFLAPVAYMPRINNISTLRPMRMPNWVFSAPRQLSVVPFRTW